MAILAFTNARSGSPKTSLSPETVHLASQKQQNKVMAGYDSDAGQVNAWK
jgi:hypothetical protein